MAGDDGHPYRDPKAALEAMAKPFRVQYRALDGSDELTYFLRHSIDDGTMLAAIESSQRGWLADRIADLEHNARTIRDGLDPYARAAKWAGITALGCAVVDALARTHRGWGFTACPSTRKLVHICPCPPPSDPISFV